MSNILNHTVCCGKKPSESETELPSMCTSDVPEDRKEENESGPDDDVDTLESLNSEINNGDKNLEIYPAMVKDRQSDMTKIEPSGDDVYMIAGNQEVGKLTETDEGNTFGGKRSIFVPQSSELFPDEEVNDIDLIKTASTLEEQSCISVTSEANRESVCRKDLNGNIHSVTTSNVYNRKDTDKSVVSDKTSDKDDGCLKMEVESTKEKLKRGKLHPIKIEVNRRWDMAGEGMGFTDDSDCDSDHTDYDKLFIDKTKGYNLKEKGKDLLKFAEVLYKCTLCTSIPSILTSEESFIRHVNRQHLSEDTRCHTCKMCSLNVRTKEDLKEHVIYSHTGSEENLSHDFPGSDITGSHDQIIDSNNDSDSDSSGHRQLRAKVVKRNKPVQDFDSPKQLVDHTGIETLNGSLDLTQKHSDEKREVDNSKGSKSCKECNEIDIKQITDQIIKSDVQGRNVSQGNHAKLTFIPGYTAEFGKYTKLVREGGNIVYFCQICNWKSPIKTTFQVHCNMTTHKNKVLTADNPEENHDSSPRSPKHSEKNFSPNSKSVNTRDKVKTPYSAQDISVGPRMPDQNLFYNFILRPRGGNQYRGRTPVVSPYGTSSFIEDARFTYKRPNEHPVDLAIKKRKRNVKHLKLGQNSDSDSDESRENENCILSKTNHLSNMTLLRQKLLEGSCGKKMAHNGKECKNVGNLQYPSDLSSDMFSKESNHFSKPSLKNEKLTFLMSDGGETNKIQKAKNYSASSEVKDGISHGASLGFKCRTKYDMKIADSLFTRYKCHACSFRYSDIDEYEKHFDKVHKSSVGNLLCLQKERSCSQGTLRTQGLGDSVTDSRIIGESGPSVDGRGELFSGRNGEQLVSGSCEMGENWRVQKLKEVLPDYVIECDRGNTSRDYLLQCISSSSGIQDAVLWSSACNRAMRELFPNSQAQRKGKYKKTYYFGISLLEAYQIQEEPPGLDGESLLYHPHRDINIDMEKIVEHLPSILRWTGNMECGIHRHDLLILLCETMQDSDACNWGAQCNRAIRLVFPNIDMKRKGKYKTTMYLGVEFQKDILKSLSKYDKRGVESQHVDLYSPVQVSNDQSTDPKNRKTLERLLTRNSNSPDIISQQESNITGKRSPVISYPQWMNKEDQIEMSQYLARFGGVSLFDVQNGTLESETYNENACDKVEQCDEKGDDTLPIEQAEDNDGDDEEESLDNVQIHKI